MPFGKFATIMETARHYGVTRQRIHQLVLDGSFGECRKFEGPGGTCWLIPIPYKRKPIVPGPGRPRKEMPSGTK